VILAETVAETAVVNATAEEVEPARGILESAVSKAETKGKRTGATGKAMVKIVSRILRSRLRKKNSRLSQLPTK